LRPAARPCSGPRWRLGLLRTGLARRRHVRQQPLLVPARGGRGLAQPLLHHPQVLCRLPGVLLGQRLALQLLLPRQALLQGQQRAQARSLADVHQRLAVFQHPATDAQRRRRLVVHVLNRHHLAVPVDDAAYVEKRHRGQPAPDVHGREPETLAQLPNFHDEAFTDQRIAQQRRRPRALGGR